jgi:hypothetical protein
MSLERLTRVPLVRAFVPAYVTEADYPWLRSLLDQRERFVGRKRREWSTRLSDGLPFEAPKQKLATALRVLERLSQDRLHSPLPPREVRATLFGEAAITSDRTRAIVQAAHRLGVTADVMLEALFADLPEERVVTALAEHSSPAQLALLCNAELIASLLGRALRVRIAASGAVRALVRHAKLVGLLCHATVGAPKDVVELEISGPYALFRHTRLYARALASLVPRLTWCRSFRLEADCVLGVQSVRRLLVSSGDPIAPARELAAFDSRAEERFAKAFGKLAPDWDVTREPVAIALGSALIFPDFELRHRGTGERWLLEIVGYWTADYLRKKLDALREARLERLIVCIDEERRCDEGALALDARIVRFRRKVDARAVLAIVDPEAARGVPEGKPRRRKRAGPDG